MNANLKKVVMVVALMAGVPATHAGGLIGDFIEGACGGCGAGRVLDGAHQQLGQPLDHAGAQAARLRGVPLSPYCATPHGIAVGPWAPVGFPCNVNGVPGMIVQ